MQTVLLNALFDDPKSISELNCTTAGVTCPDWFDTEYPIDPDLIQPAYAMVLDMLLNANRFPINDSSNDAQDSQTSK